MNTVSISGVYRKIDSSLTEFSCGITLYLSYTVYNVFSLNLHCLYLFDMQCVYKSEFFCSQFLDV